MKRFIGLAAALLASTALAACSTADCDLAKKAVTLGRIALEKACTSQSQDCDAAGLALKVANMGVELTCPAGTIVPP